LLTPCGEGRKDTTTILPIVFVQGPRLAQRCGSRSNGHESDRFEKTAYSKVARSAACVTPLTPNI